MEFQRYEVTKMIGDFTRMLIRKLLRTRTLLAITCLLIILYILKEFRTLKRIKHTGDDIDATIMLKPRFFVPKSFKRIDWHDHEMILLDSLRVGIGEQGKAARLPNEKKMSAIKLFSLGYSASLSDMIPLNRSLPDIRHPKCMNKRYIESLPSVSVVVPYYNEHRSTLLRTVYSVLSRSPQHLIKEIILVDDASTNPEITNEILREYLSEKASKVEILRFENRIGFIQARLVGADQATGDVIVFLNPCSEVTTNWLPPLLDPIALNPRTVMCPFTDDITYDTFEYRARDEGARGVFDWTFVYRRLPLLPRDLDNMPKPFMTPVMGGEVFAISRWFFWELGGYDPGLRLSGGEQYELSFKIWQCGGRILDAPCSRVGVLNRKPLQIVTDYSEAVGTNYKRIAEVWMDIYAEYLYMHRPHYRLIDPGDVSEQRAVRERLKCKSFRWYMTQVAFDLTQHFPLIEPLPYAEGTIQLTRNRALCIEASTNSLKINKCSKQPSPLQQFELTFYKDIRLKGELLCWEWHNPNKSRSVTLLPCQYKKPQQLWQYIQNKQQLRHNSGFCLDYESVTARVQLNKCNNSVVEQRWTFATVNKYAMAKWNENVPSIVEPREPWKETTMNKNQLTIASKYIAQH